MKDSRIQKIAALIVNHSIKVQPNEHILIQTNTEIEVSVVREIIKEIHIAGGFAHSDLRDATVTIQLVLGGTKEQFEVLAEIEVDRLAKMDGYINLRSPVNTSELSDFQVKKWSYTQRHTVSFSLKPSISKSRCQLVSLMRLWHRKLA